MSRHVTACDGMGGKAREGREGAFCYLPADNTPSHCPSEQCSLFIGIFEARLFEGGTTINKRDCWLRPLKRLFNRYDL
jgi:hypothetical protein